MAIENLASGSLIIPMDVAYQDKGMFLAYGLVYRLLNNGIPVKWAIKDNKAYDATDFSATTRNYTNPAEIPTSKSYAGGPFIVPAANAAAAGAIIDAYQAANLAQFPAAGRQPVVHVATAAFNADIAYTLSRAPRIAMEDTNANIMIGYLNTSKIPDSRGLPWDKDDSPGVLTETEIDNGALLGIDRSQVPPPSELCLKNAYDIFLSPHTSDGAWQNTPAAIDLVQFLEQGGFLHATCHSMSALNNFDAGPMLNPIGQTNYGDNKGDASTFTVDLADYPTAQAVSRGPGAVQDLPGGSEQTWLHTDVTYFSSVYQLAHFLDNSTVYDFMAGGSFRGTGAGVVVFEGGHEYKDTDKIPASASYSTVTDSVYQRFVLNTVFASVGKPYLEMTVTPQNVSSTALTPVTFTLTNTGGAPAIYTSPFVITLAPFVNYTPGTAIPVPDSEVMMGGQWVLTYNVGTLPGGPGTVATIPAVIDPTLVGGTIPSGKNQAVTYQVSWNDAYNQVASIDQCTAITALPGAAPNIEKVPLTQSVTPNALATWNINVSNNGTLPIDSALGPPPFEITDTLPAGWTYDPGTTTTPSSVTVNLDGTTTIVWSCPASCPPMLDPLLPGGSFTVTLGAFAPSAVTETYTNLATLTGTDGTTNFDINAQATVNVVNRPPTVTVDNPVQGDVSCTGVDIQWTASDPDGDTPLEITLFYSSTGPGGPFTQITTVPSPLLDPPTGSFFWDTTGLPSGNNYVILVIASDGELLDEAFSGTFIVDNTPPTVSWITPTNGALLSTTPVTLQASATDNVAVSTVQFFYSEDGITYNLIGNGLPIGGNIYETNWEIAGLDQGPYFLRVVATDQCQRTSQQTINVTVDLPPEVNIINPPPPDVVCPPGTDIIWEATDENPNATLTFDLEYSADGGPFQPIVNGLPGPCSPTCSYSWNTTGLPSGSYVIKVIAYDGILTAEDLSDPFIVDNTPPTVSWVSPSTGDLITTSPVTLQASATDNVGVTQVLFQYSDDGGSTWTDIGTDTTAVGNVYSVPWNFSSLPAGSYILRAVASDGCGQTGLDRITVTVDLPPTVTLLSPNGGEIVCQPGTTISWNAEDPNGDPLFYSLLYSSDGGTIFNIIASGLTGDCPAPGPPCTYFWNTSTLPSGSNYLIKVIATDGVLSAEDVSDATFIIDNTPPDLNVTFPSEGSFLVGSVTLSATATDNVSVTGVTFEYSEDGTTFNLIGTVYVPLDSTYALPWDTTTVPDGPKIIRATASDQCNNTTVERINITVDNTPPTVDIPSPEDGSTVSGEVPILVEASDNECLAKVELYIDGILVQTVIVDGGATSEEFIYEWDTTEVAEGPHELKAIATDCAGLTATTINNVIVDNLPEHYQQILVDGNLTIPDQKPDVETVIDMAVTPTVENINIFSTIDGTKVTVTGFVEIGITYSISGSQAEHFAHFMVPFHAMILYPDLPLDAKVEAVIVVEHKQWHLLDPRTIKKDIVLFVGIRRVC